MFYNPRSREGNDDIVNEIERYIKVSIHVPAKGTTVLDIKFIQETRGFNPRSREGNDKTV